MAVAVPGEATLSAWLRGVRWLRNKGTLIAGPAKGGAGRMLAVAPLVTSSDGGVAWSIPPRWLVTAGIIIMTPVCGARLWRTMLQATAAVADAGPAVIVSIVIPHSVRLVACTLIMVYI